MKLGLQVNNFAWQGSPGSIRKQVGALVRRAEEAGFYSVWAMDHYFQIEDNGPASDPMLEAYTLLGYFAAITERVKLGTMVTGAIYHLPGILVKTITTLDVISGGRAYFGVGAGWFEQEARGLGLPFPTVSGRFELLEETLQIARQMWSANNGPYQGGQFQLAKTLNSPQPISQPHPPILIGGAGEKKTLRLVAQYGDACNLWYSDMADLRHKLDVLRAHCKDVGRDYEQIEKTVVGDPPEKGGHVDADAFIAECRRLAEVGVTHWIVEHRKPLTGDDLRPYADEIIPAIYPL